MNMCTMLASLLLAASPAARASEAGAFESEVERTVRSVTAMPSRLASDKIVGGSEAAKGEFPFIVSFERAGKPFCGGSLVAKNWVLTANHCREELLDWGVRAVVGAHDLRDRRGTESFSIAETVPHPESQKIPSYDFVLVRLDGGSKFPAIALNRKELSGPAELVVAGWGRTDDDNPSSHPSILQKATLPLVPPAKCAQAYPGYRQLDESMLCAGPEGDGRRHSKGDSGGPLVLGSGAERVLVGVVSWHDPGKYGVYGKVSAVASWIDATIK